MSSSVMFGAGSFIVLIAAVCFFAYSQRRPPSRPPRELAYPEPARFMGPAIAAPMPDLLQLHVAYGERREREEKERMHKEALDGIAYWAGKIPTAPPAGTTPPTPPNA